VRAPRSPSTRPARPKSKPSDVFSER
jgi:hypothetical protein